jgi:hypothetical protein
MQVTWGSLKSNARYQRMTAGTVMNNDYDQVQRSSVPLWTLTTFSAASAAQQDYCIRSDQFLPACPHHHPPIALFHQITLDM